MDMDVERRIAAIAKEDHLYCELLDRCSVLSADYHRIRCSLSDEDQDLLEMYISACEELEYQRACIAYILGTQDGLLSGTAQLQAK